MGPKFNDIAKENIGNKIIQFIKDKDKNFNIYSNQNLLSQPKYPWHDHDFYLYTYGQLFI